MFFTGIFVRCLTGDPALPFPFELVISEFTILALIVPPGIAILPAVAIAAADALSTLLPVAPTSA